MKVTWTRAAVEALGPTTNVKTAASVVGIGDRLAYESIQRGEWSPRWRSGAVTPAAPSAVGRPVAGSPLVGSAGHG
jgi:hypothetical protein